MSTSKRYAELAKKIDKSYAYSAEEALALVKETATTKFDSSIEVHVNLGIDPRKGDQQIRNTLTLPHGTGKSKKIAVFTANAEAEAAAKGAGADFVYGEEAIAELARTGKIEFEVAVATPDMMPKLAKVAKILGPRGLMPSPKNETVTPNVAKAVTELKGGRVAYKNDDTANVHQVIGRASFDAAKLVENFQAFMDSLRKAKPASAKGQYIRSVTVTSTMGPGVKVNL
jgi:large subunit ribosomal protein L1